jgi:hypothetical protein
MEVIENLRETENLREKLRKNFNEENLKNLFEKVIEEFDKNGYCLTYFGYSKKNENMKTIDIETCSKNERLKMLMHILPIMIEPRKTTTINSYEAKHVVEKMFEHSYISNGEMILVMHSLGYKHKKLNGLSPNIDYYANLKINENSINHMYKFNL